MSTTIVKMRKERESGEYKVYSDEWLIELYFRYGSVDDALKHNNITVPFSFADIHRRLESAGIVKSAGRHTSFSEALHFFREKQLAPGTPLESIYKTMPASFKTSMETLHRIYNRVQAIKTNNIVSRYATALVISPEENPDKVLIATERYSTSKYGKIAGLNTIPMTFSRVTDTHIQRVIRVLQQEVLTKDAIEKRFANLDYLQNLISSLEVPFVKYRLLDVEVTCFMLSLPTSVNRFSSFKLKDHQFVNTSEVLENSNSFRAGVSEIVKQSITSRQNTESEEFLVESNLNIDLIKAVPSRTQA